MLPVIVDLLEIVWCTFCEIRKIQYRALLPVNSGGSNGKPPGCESTLKDRDDCTK
jgi:hypothetical protein